MVTGGWFGVDPPVLAFTDAGLCADVEPPSSLTSPRARLGNVPNPLMDGLCVNGANTVSHTQGRL